MKLSALVLALGISFSGSVFATQAVWDTTAPWGTATTSQYAEWNVFNSTNDTSPEVALSAGTTASVRETTGASFVTSGGNIYSFAAATAFTSTLSGTAGGLFDVYLRISTVGTLANTTATLNGVNATLVSQLYESQGDFGGFGTSYEQEAYWKWTGVTGSSLYTFNFSSSSSSMSLDQVALATVAVPTVTPVPEPEAYSMMALGLGLMAFAARRSSKKA
jgi:hypothetical protein